MENVVHLLTAMRAELEQHEYSLDLDALAYICTQQHVRGHLAILTRPYLEKIVKKQKTIESRFSKVRTPPFSKIQVGDVVFLKEVAGPIHAIAFTSQVHSFGPMNEGEAEQVMREYQEGLLLENDFKSRKQNSLYATLISLETVLPIKPLHLEKRDRRSWVVLTRKNEVE